MTAAITNRKLKPMTDTTSQRETTETILRVTKGRPIQVHTPPKKLKETTIVKMMPESPTGHTITKTTQAIKVDTKVGLEELPVTTSDTTKSN